MKIGFDVFFAAFSLFGCQMVGIGPQNSLLLKQGIGRQHVLLLIMVFVLCDVLLIVSGVFGLGGLLASHPVLVNLLVWLGGGMMLWLSYRAFHSACRPAGWQLDGGALDCPHRVLKSALLVTLCNPLVWVDSVVLVGSVSAAYGLDGQWYFMSGAVLASALWFIVVGLGAGRLAPWFQRPQSWRKLDLSIGILMLASAVMLLYRHG